MPLTIGNNVFTTSLPDVDGLVMVTCLNDPNLSFTVDLGVNSLNDEAVRYFDRIMLSSPSREYRYEQARNPGPLLADGNIASMKFTNVRHSFTIYWSSEPNNDKVVIKDVLKNTLLEKTGLSIGSQNLRDFFVENFPLRLRINTSSLQDQYRAIITSASAYQGNNIDQISYEELENHSGMAPQVIQSVDDIIQNMRREYNLDLDVLTETFARNRRRRNTEEKEEVPPPYTKFVEPPSYNDACA